MKMFVLLPVLIPALAQAGPTIIDGVSLTTQTVATGLDQPLFLTSPPGDSRLFVVEKTGRIRIIKDGVLLADPFLDLSARIATNSERGLLGLAFPPDYATSQRFFVYFTDIDGNNHVAALTASGNRADAGSLVNLLTIPHPIQSNHNGGWIGFGPDGYLYIGTGDGGGAGDPLGNGQNPDVLLGKMLRIDVSKTPYAIPPDNPFAQGGGAPEVFFTGLRNPWRNAFDGTTFYIADVGQNRFEEINIVPLTPGLNFGWNLMEGLACFRDKPCETAGITLPAHVYDHDHGCSVTGGYVYRGQAIPALQGRYFYADYCSGEVMSLRHADGKAVDLTESGTLQPLAGLTSFGQDSAGEIYMTFGSDGTVEKLVPAP